MFFFYSIGLSKSKTWRYTASTIVGAVCVCNRPPPHTGQYSRATLLYVSRARRLQAKRVTLSIRWPLAVDRSPLVLKCQLETSEACPLVNEWDFGVGWWFFFFFMDMGKGEKLVEIAIDCC